MQEVNTEGLHACIQASLSTFRENNWQARVCDGQRPQTAVSQQLTTTGDCKQCQETDGQQPEMMGDSDA